MKRCCYFECVNVEICVAGADVEGIVKGDRETKNRKKTHDLKILSYNEHVIDTIR